MTVTCEPIQQKPMLLSYRLITIPKNNIVCYLKKKTQNDPADRTNPFENQAVNIALFCSRKNLVFLFGVLINLTVRVDTYFHPIRMTYPIHPDHFSWQHQIGESPLNTFSCSEGFELDRRLSVCSLDSSSLTNP